jgi:hypothetical protein
MSRKRKRFDRKKKLKLRRFLAERDGLVPPEAFERFSDPYVRCAECDGLVPFSEITIGHVLPLSEGGANDPENLRLECGVCNQDDNNYRLLVRALDAVDAGRKTLGLRVRVARMAESREGRRLGRVYDSVRVQDIHGRHASFTSIKQAGVLLRSGKVRVVESETNGTPRVVQLTHEIPIVNPDEIERPNRCVICDAERYLSCYSYWPRWHPEWNGARKTHRTVSLCRVCIIQAQQWQESTLAARGFGSSPVRMGDADRRLKGILIQTHQRLKKGLELPADLRMRLKECAGVDLDLDLQALGPTGTMASISCRISALKRTYVDQERGLRHRQRRHILEANVDFHENFWEFVSNRRAMLAPFLRTDGSLIPLLEDQLRRVREEIQLPDRKRRHPDRRRTS